ncbi:hypothetical protein MHYP_G00032290 [Metynnis hypsauchen]
MLGGRFSDDHRLWVKCSVDGRWFNVLVITSSTIAQLQPSGGHIKRLEGDHHQGPSLHEWHPCQCRWCNGWWRKWNVAGVPSRSERFMAFGLAGTARTQGLGSMDCSDLTACTEETVRPAVVMAARALSCTLTLLVWAGVSLGQLVLPSRQDGAVGGNVVFQPISRPSETFEVITWRFGGTGGQIVIRAIGGTVSTPRPEYSGRASLDINTLALELRNLRMNDAGVYALSVDGNTASYSAETTLEVFEVSLGQLALPSRQDGVVGGNVVFQPISRPSETFEVITWRFGGTGGQIIIRAIGGTVSTPRPEYSGRASLDINTLALELRNLRMNDAGVYALSVDGITASYSAETTLEVFGVSLGQLALPSRQVGVAGGNVVFQPISRPSETFEVITWRFGGTGGQIIIRAIGGTVSTPLPEYSGRASLDINTLALELRNLRMNDAGVYVLSVDGNTASYSAETTLEVFGE